MVEYKRVALSNLGLDEVGSNPTYHKKNEDTVAVTPLRKEL